MVECSSCGEKFKSLEEFDGHISGACAPIDAAGVVRHAVAVRQVQKRGGKRVEVSSAPSRETR